MSATDDDDNTQPDPAGDNTAMEDPINNIITPTDGLVIFPNPEKSNRFKLGDEEFMPMSSSRILLSAMPGCGKRNVILNIIYRMKPKPTHVHLVHCDPSTIEYDCLGDLGIPFSIYSPSEFPTLENIENPNGGELGDPDDEDAEEDADDDKPILSNPLVIVDECTHDQLGTHGSSRFERMVNHVCTHRNTTLICSIQSLINIPPKARRGFNHLVLWKQADKSVNQMAAVRAGVPYDMLCDLFELLKTKYDFIWIDLDQDIDNPWRFRLNMISPISIIRK